jgi:hypothetical protein
MHLVTLEEIGLKPTNLSQTNRDTFINLDQICDIKEHVQDHTGIDRIVTFIYLSNGHAHCVENTAEKVVKAIYDELYPH